ncbi:hypothetical protein Adu01nite_83930 [Paractinoplanes durhamensis]|uniref:ATP-binding protein n=1 Tax=Paractinoplanes durhamensis TaxID=113563 RepID=A0ABQ3ZB34_9ACTN|nr:hypothetical protein [Actinoplanes durhamensis]GIE07043.1 hypothetical protein Adu01nite_83930 [Actinoplanes durhamensis]
MPTYVDRSFDFPLRTVLSANLPDRGSFVVMVGGSSAGKTRSLYEAVYALVPDWSLVQPAEAAELLDLRNAPPRSTVFWLDELQRYLGGKDALTAECVRALVRHGNLVVGTLWPDQYAKWTSGRDDVYRLLQIAVPISVPESLDLIELSAARAVAVHDSRIQDALNTSDDGMTQVLAGGPRLVMCWEQPANPYVKAIIAAAADAHRLGVQSPLSEELLADAMFGYLKPRDRVRPAAQWLAAALPHATRPTHGDVSPLYPVDDGRAGTLAGYTIADYLAQHVRRRRRSEPLPHKAWLALVTHLQRPEDLRRVANGAIARLRYCYAEPALTRLAAEFGDGRAAAELADLLVRQDRLKQAVEVLRHQVAADPQDTLAGQKLSDIQRLWQRVEQMRLPARRRARGLPDEVAEILADGGVGDELRRQAAAGNAMAAERLVELLADRGCLRELRERADHGERRAAEALADLYAAWGDVHQLQARADAGDRDAELRLSKTHLAQARHEGAKYQIGELRAAADEGRAEAALQLCTLLFELRDADSLRAELDAGTTGAADRLIALYTAQDHRSLIQVRAFGLDADGHPLTNVRGKDS